MGGKGHEEGSTFLFEKIQGLRGVETLRNSRFSSLQHGGHGQAADMKQGQDADMTIAAAQGQQLYDLEAGGDEVILTQDDSPRLAVNSGGMDDHEIIPAGNGKGRLAAAFPPESLKGESIRLPFHAFKGVMLPEGRCRR